METKLLYILNCCPTVGFTCFTWVCDWLEIHSFIIISSPWTELRYNWFSTVSLIITPPPQPTQLLLTKLYIATWLIWVKAGAIGASNVPFSVQMISVHNDRTHDPYSCAIWTADWCIPLIVPASVYLSCRNNTNGRTTRYKGPVTT